MFKHILFSILIFLYISNCSNKDLYIDNKSLDLEKNISITKFELIDDKQEYWYDIYLKIFGMTSVTLSFSNPILILPIVLGTYYIFDNSIDLLTEDLNQIIKETNTTKAINLNMFNKELLRSELNYISIYENPNTSYNNIDYRLKILMLNNKQISIQIEDKSDEKVFLYSETNTTINDFISHLTIKIKDQSLKSTNK